MFVLCHGKSEPSIIPCRTNVDRNRSPRHFAGLITYSDTDKLLTTKRLFVSLLAISLIATISGQWIGWLRRLPDLILLDFLLQKVYKRARRMGNTTGQGFSTFSTLWRTYCTYFFAAHPFVIY
jgi:hypothetical protein